MPRAFALVVRGMLKQVQHDGLRYLYSVQIATLPISTAAITSISTPFFTSRRFAISIPPPIRHANAPSIAMAGAAAAQRWAAEKLRLVVEPGGAVGLAAVLAGKVPVEPGLLVILSGGNVDLAGYAKAIAG